MARLCEEQAQEHEYDVIGHPQLNFNFVVVFPFHPYTDGRKGGEVHHAFGEKTAHSLALVHACKHA